MALLLGGLLAMIVSGGALLLRWYAAESWAGSEEAAQAARQLDAPAPRWLDEPGASPAVHPAGTARPASAPPTTPQPAPASGIIAGGAQPPAAARPDSRSGRPASSDASEIAGAAVGRPDARASLPDSSDAREREGPASESHADGPDSPTDGSVSPAVDEATRSPGSSASGPTPTPAPHAPASDIKIEASAFEFLDPPEPGAQARIAVQLQNRSPLPTGPLRLALSTRWLSGWRVMDATPPVLDDRVLDDARRAFEYPGLDGTSEGSLELHLVATDDAVDPPEIGLGLADRAGGETPIGKVRPETVAPRPRPGPARALEVPRLNLRAAVVPTAWEPPGWVVGQLRNTANLSEGNTVLIGHLTGLAGNVFAHLDDLEPGDEIIATSRGLEYRFVVSETMVLPNDDSLPVQPTDGPRLTLMTCSGDWDPIGHDYSHRLWVVAEPPELAEATLERGEPGPLTRQLGLAPPVTILPPVAQGPSPKEVEPPAEPVRAAPEPGAEIVTPDEGALVDGRTLVRGRRTEGADPRQPLWLAIRAEIEGSRWYLYDAPLAVGADGGWEAGLEIGGGPGIRHTIVVAPVDAATDARLRRQVRERPGEPLAILPDAFEAGARVTVERR